LKTATPARRGGLSRPFRLHTGLGGSSPRSTASRLSTRTRVIASRVSSVALPTCGVRTTFGSPSSSRGTSGS